MATMTAREEVIRSEFTTGLINAHAVEKQAIELIERQLERARNYPMVAEQLRRHLIETKRQEERLDHILDSFDESRSIFKDTMMKLSANMGAMSHAMADDEILKNTFANVAFESFEIAAYQSLIEMARTGGYTEAETLLRESLEEEMAMERWLKENVASVTSRYLELKASGESADR